VAALERRVGVRLLQRSTRTLALTEAGEQFYARCVSAVEGAQASYESLAEMRREPSGTVRMSCPVVMAQSYLAPILPDYLAKHPKVKVLLEATDRPTRLIEERFDLALRALPQMDGDAGLVIQPLGSARRILVASPGFLRSHGRPAHPTALTEFNAICHVSETIEGVAHWSVTNAAAETVRPRLNPRLVTSDLRVQFEAAVHGIGVALMPEPLVTEALRKHRLAQVLPDWSAQQHHIHLAYPPPRGMLPSVRSLIDHLMAHMPGSIDAHQI
jgi:DNA-binding transcriptional LysR family regulator